MARDNAAVRMSFASEIYEQGVSIAKEKVLSEIKAEYAELHRNGDIHIHDLESFAKTYNCCTPDWINILTASEYTAFTDSGKIMEVFEKIKETITLLAVNQSGGIGFGNFDSDLSTIFNFLNIVYSPNNIKILYDIMHLFICWLNNVKTRFCREPYYVTVNIGLDTSKWGRTVSEILLTEFKNSPMNFTRPNIVFKLNHDINADCNSVNHNIYILACECTAKRMIPTYLLTDSKPNKDCNPEKLNIMGCRTRVYSNVNGEQTTIGRGNIGYISINLPRLALKNKTINTFYTELKSIIEICYKILVYRNKLFLKNNGKYTKFVREKHIWYKVTTDKDMLKQGTYSIGFIGLSETVEIITGKRPYESNEGKELALKIIQFMRLCIEDLKKSTGLNISLLATPGEMLSGRFCNIDKELYSHNIQQKGFYTNSFHVNVDSNLSILDKIDYEAPFHSLCNGGCISYVEFAEAPMNNIMALQDILRYSVQKGISYIGFNYPLDVCNNCNTHGTFDKCPVCHSLDITRIRRVSGYLEDADGFTDGKKSELKFRVPNVRKKGN